MKPSSGSDLDLSVAAAMLARAPRLRPSDAVGVEDCEAALEELMTKKASRDLQGIVKDSFNIRHRKI